MDQMPKITATITIVETGEKHEVLFDNVVEMMETITWNVSLASVVYNRPIDVSEVQVDNDCDDAYFAYSFADTYELYMTVAATRHVLQ